MSTSLRDRIAARLTRTASAPTDEPSGQASVSVSLPRSHRRTSSGPAAQRRDQQRRRQQGSEERPHGFRRADDQGAGERPSFAFFDRRRADGTPLLLFVMLGVLTCVGMAQVHSRIEILALANEITELSEDQQRLLDRKRRLETERAYLRRPERVRAQADQRLGMQPAPPERIQRIELLPSKPAPTEEDR
jgi:cell division protein FtsL